MITWKYKLWQTAGAAAALSLAACGQGETPAPAESEAPATPATVPDTPVVGEAGGEQGEAGVATAYAGVTGDQLTALRLQHLKGFLLIADRVAADGAAPEAGVLVQQGLLEVYDPAAAEFGALNVEPVRAAANAASTQSIDAGEAAINAARTGLAIDNAALAARMLDLSTGLYQHVIQADFIDPIEYQHSLGAALAARDALVAGEATLKASNARAYANALAELDRFIALWPAATAPERPATYAQVLAASSRVRLALSPFL
jgi:hypothetical protein